MSSVDGQIGELFREAMLARPRVYRVGRPTPLTRVRLGGAGEVWLKREDASPIHSYKWRGAVNRVSVAHERGEAASVVAASAGNHAQGVAIAAARLGLKAAIFMPRSTPSIKVREARRIGGSSVRVELVGDSYDDAASAAEDEARETGALLIPPYDDLHVIAGQATVGDEIVQSAADFAEVYVPVGGGGLAAGVACVIKAHRPDVRVIGVEAEGQASMRAALDAGERVTLGKVDRFCDGTAVGRAGALTFPLCARLLDDVVLVTNDEVCAAVQAVWEACRAVPEPSGALAIAAAMRRDASRGESVAILSGGNMDFEALSRIARRGGIGRLRRRYYAFPMTERSGSLVGLLDRIGDAHNIIDFQYGKTDHDRAEPVIGFEAGPRGFEDLEARLRELGIEARDVTGSRSVDFRVIPLRPDLFRLPYFAVLGFPNRGGALRDFMRRVGSLASICYFNYASTGEEVGRALMGFEFESDEGRAAFFELLEGTGLDVEPAEETEQRLREPAGPSRAVPAGVGS